MDPRPRIYISAPVNENLDARQRRLKEGILDAILGAGFAPQEFLASGAPLRKSWSFLAAQEIMEKCQGAVILAFAQWHVSTSAGPIVMPTEYNHYEGALALSSHKETLIVAEEEVASRGITWSGGGQVIVRIPSNANRRWLRTDDFKSQFDAWCEKVRSRHHVFLGYSSKASSTASAIIKYLISLGVSVRDWETHFHAGGTILDEIEEAVKSCLCGVFLFMHDDDLLSGDAKYAAPRDNVIFEAGYFMHAKGRERTLIIREEGAKMPADISGSIYLPLKDRTDISTIKTQLRDFIEARLEA